MPETDDTAIGEVVLDLAVTRAATAFACEPWRPGDNDSRGRVLKWQTQGLKIPLRQPGYEFESIAATG